MACNCGKRTQPTGFGQSGKSQQEVQREGAKTQQSFTLTDRNGTTSTYGSLLEASAARVRSGGGVISS